MTDQVRRSRVVSAAAAVVVVLCAAGCGDGGGSSAAASSPTPAPSTSYDKATVRACKLADKAGRGVDDAAFKAARDAVSTAATSDVAVLREIAEKYAATGSNLDAVNTQTGAIRISTWCLDHQLTKPDS